MPLMPRAFSPTVQAVIADFLPICRILAGDQPYAVAVGGSLGKGTWDARSDVDFRLYIRDEIPWSNSDPVRWSAYHAAIERWKQRGVFVDGVWVRTVGEIETAIDAWTGGHGEPVPLVWTIWGYHILPDMFHQHILEDPFGIIAGWKERLSLYPPRLKQAVLARYTESLRYWREDYHYQNKVERGDMVFLAGLSAKLVHEVLQILFALNETYYVGDGSNLAFARNFKLAPPDLEARVRAALYPAGEDPFRSQARALAGLIDEVLEMAAQPAPSTNPA